MYCHVTTETAFCVFHFLQRFFPEWPIRTCSKITAVLLLCTDDDNRSYRNVCSMPFLSFALAVIFIIRLFSTSAFRVPKLIGSHFGSEAKVLLRKVELAQRKAVRHQAAADFLTKCVTYNLSPGSYSLNSTGLTYRRRAACTLFAGFCWPRNLTDAASF